MAINLIPTEEKVDSHDYSFIYKGVFVGFLTVALLGLVLGVKYFINQAVIDNLVSQEQELTEEEASYSVFKESLDKYKSTSYFQILGKHTYYTDFFKSLEDATSKNIRVVNLSMEEGNTVSVTGEAKGDYSDVAQFSQFLKKESFEEVKILTANLSGDKVSFSMSFKYPESMVLR